MAKLKVFFCGPHSTGKTTLLNDVVPHLQDIKIVGEVARGVIKRLGWTRDDFTPDKHPDAFFKLNSEIIKEQIRQDCINSLDEQDFICDRALDAMVYVRFYIGEEARNKLYDIEGIANWIQSMRSSVVFLLQPHQECITEDVVRLKSSLDELFRLYHAFEAELKDDGIPYCKIIDLDRSARVAAVLGEIRRRQSMHIVPP